MEDSENPGTPESAVKPKGKPETGVGVATSNGCGPGETDPDLDQLLDASLNEFGKHVPPSSATPTSSEGGGATPGRPPGLMGRTMSRVDDQEDPMMNELEKVFGEEIAAQAEAELTKAMELLATENPELLKEFESFANTIGLTDPQAEPSAQTTAPPPSGTKNSLEAILEETVRNIQKSGGGAQAGESIGDMPPKLAEMMSKLHLDLPEEEGDSIMSAMENMMGTLLSKDVLYPSLMDFCSQYPEWLRSHGDSLSPEDKARYSKQLDIMTAICREFEKEEGEESQRQERILQLMQQLQECGQPPDDLGGGPIPTPLLSPGVLPSPNEQCIVM